MRHTLQAALAASAVVWLAVGTSAQAPIQVTSPGRVTVRAEGVPLGDLLRQLSTMVEMDRLKIAPDALNALVTVEAEDVPVDVAMLEVLRASNVDYVLSGSRLLAGGATNPGALREGRTDRGKEAAVVPPVSSALPPNAGRSEDRERGRAEGGTVAVAQAAAAETTSTPVLSDESADQFGFLVGAEVIRFKVVEDSVVVETPGFVPYKLRPDVKARRMAIDVTKIP